MNEQRQQDYLNLIQALLECPNGEEFNILNAHPHLIDADLVDVMAQVAEMMAQHGKENNAKFLTDWAQEIVVLLEEYRSFLGEVLQATAESDGDAQVVYPILFANQDKLNDILVGVYPDWASNIFLDLEPEKAPNFAVVFYHFSKLIEQFPSGNRASNLEITIIGYELVLKVLTRDKFSQAWAMTQVNLGRAYCQRLREDKAENLEKAIACYEQGLLEFSREKFAKNWVTIQDNLGFAYSNRIRGDKAENLEKAIAYYELALQVRKQDNLPQVSAGTQHNLGTTYTLRIRGDKAENVEKAIACYELALQEYTRDKSPEDWAMTQDSLGFAYSERLRGNKAENVEKAIACYELSLQVRTEDKFPQDWAKTQTNLGTAYRNRIKGDRVENLEKAIACYNLALQVRREDKFPQDWAMTQHNLGFAYNNRIRGDKAENLEKAIACYNLALEEYTKDKFPENWAMTQNNLGNAYSDELKGDKAENWEKAIAYYEAALTVHTRKAYPEDWAMIQNNLGRAYIDRPKGNPAEDLEKEIYYYELALQEYTKDKFPENWAITQNNLGNAYKERRIDRTEYLKKAIHCWRSALEIHTPTTFPIDCLRVGRNLGKAAFTAGKWEIAIEGYKQAIDAVEESRTQAISDDRRQEIVAEAVGVYGNIVQAYINQGQIDKAIEYVERSRSKRLVDLMASNDLYAGSEIPPQVQAYLQQYDELQAQIDAERKRLQRDSDSSKQPTDKSTVALTRAAFEAATVTIKSLEAQKQQIWEQMRRLDPVLAGEIQVTPLDFATIQQLIDTSHTAILNLFMTNNDTHIFIIYKDKKPQLHTCTGFGYQVLRELVFDDWLIPYFEKKKDGIWYGKISEFLQQLAEKLQIKTLVQTYLSSIEELIIIPHLFWHQMPFAALPLTIPTPVNSQPPENQPSGMIRQVIETFTRLGGGKKTISGTLPTDTEIVSTQYLGDKFRLRYVPSSQILQYCQQRPPLSQINYGTVENPDSTLPNAEFECEKIAKFYNIPDDQRLKGRDQATVSNYCQLAKQVQVLHSSHHASSRLDSPLESVLILADGNITLGQIMTPGFRLPNLSDVFLSCCETNLGVTGITDDILSLSTGFLCAGARSVVSTLWAVDDLATALFSIFYYQNRQGGLNRTEALQQAQFKLRTLSGKILVAEYKGELETHLQHQGQQAIDKCEKAKKNCKRLFEGTPEYQRWDEEYKHWNAIASRIFKIKENLKKLCREELPFAGPYYWAGFICSGLR